MSETENTNSEQGSANEPETQERSSSGNLTDLELYAESEIMNAGSFYNERAEFGDIFVLYYRKAREVAITPSGAYLWNGNEIDMNNPNHSSYLPLYSSIPSIISRKIKEEGMVYFIYHSSPAWYLYYTKSGGDIILDKNASWILTPFKNRILKNDPVMKLVLQNEIRREQVERFAVNQYAISRNIPITDGEKRFYKLLLLQWLVAARDDYNMQDGSNWTILQKCMEYGVNDYVKDSRQTTIWNGITEADLSPPIVAGRDWLGKYPINPNSTYNLVGTTGNSFLRNASDLYDADSNYSEALGILEYGNVKNLYERY